MSLIKRFALASLAILGITATVGPMVGEGKRLLACNMGALSKEQRAQHMAMTRRLLESAKREEVAGGYLFTIDRSRVSGPDVAEWVANEARCCPGVDFHLRLPAEGPLTLRIDGGDDVKAFLAGELRLR